MNEADLDHAYRSEAKAVPNLLVAPVSPTAPPLKQDIYEDYPQGYYADGAYTATPLPSSNTGLGRTRVGSEASDVDPQEAYYTALSMRFSALSSHLQHPPALPANGVLNIPAGLNTSKEWRDKILYTSPKMGVLALLQQEMVIRGLEVLEDLLSAGNLRGGAGKNVGAWAWGLLARCRELGTMGSEEVGVVRRVGKRGVHLLRRIRAGEVVEVEDVGVGGEGDDDSDGEADHSHVDVAQEKQDEQEDEDENDTESIAAIDPIRLPEDSIHLLSPPAEAGVDDALAAARARMLASLDAAHQKPEVNNDAEGQYHQQDQGTGGELGREGVMGEEAVHATLDMIVTIVGEFYGQRDLLDGRVLWDEMV